MNLSPFHSSYTEFAESMLSTVRSLTGNALPYAIENGIELFLPCNQQISFLDTTNDQQLENAMKSLDVCARSDPFDLIYAERLTETHELCRSLHPKGKIFLTCPTNQVKLIVKQAHESGLSWAEWVEFGKDSGIVLRKQRKPRNTWDGSGRGSVLVYSDWGWGDLFQNLRYLPLIRDHIGPIIMEAGCGVTPLLKQCCPVDSIIRKGEMLPHTDYSLELCDAHNFFGFKSSAGYLSVDRTRRGGFNIGVSWKGHHLSFNRHRDVDPNLFSLLRTNGIKLHCVQKFTKRSYIPRFIETHDLQDWLTTARLINSMDLIITVDTSVAHLSAALGKETWVILSPELYYTPIHTNPSWYDNVRIFHTQGNQEEYFTELGNKLYTFLTKRFL